MTEKKPLLTRSDIMALSALLISAIALIVSMYEAGIMKEQQEIMISQQKASVWPYVDGNISYQFGDRFQMTYSLVNKGVGPAIIKNGKLMINDSSLELYDGDIKKALAPFFPVDSNIRLSLSLMDNKVLSPEEEYQILLLETELPESDSAMSLIQRIDIRYDACFCSIYNECWSLEEEEVGKKMKCD